MKDHDILAVLPARCCCWLKWNHRTSPLVFWWSIFWIHVFLTCMFQSPKIYHSQQQQQEQMVSDDLRFSDLNLIQFLIFIWPEGTEKCFRTQECEPSVRSFESLWDKGEHVSGTSKYATKWPDTRSGSWMNTLWPLESIVSLSHGRSTGTEDRRIFL